MSLASMEKPTFTFTLEILPYDAIVQVLHSFENFSELYDLLSASPISLRLFNNYPISILTQTAQNIIGPAAWGSASAVLTYQRKRPHMDTYFKHIITIRQELNAPFCFQRADIPRLIANQKFFKACSEDCKKSLPSGIPTMWCVMPYAVDFDPTRFSHYSGFTSIPNELFYRTWLLALRYQHESVVDFGLTPIASEKVYNDMHIVSTIMSRHSQFKKHCAYDGAAGAEEYLCGGLSSGLFAFKRKGLWSVYLGESVHGFNPPIYMKLMSHLFRKLNKGVESDSFLKKVTFTQDYSTMSVKQLVEKYQLDTIGVAEAQEGIGN